MKTKASYGMKNKHHSDAAKRKMSDKIKGKPRSEEIKRKISLTHKLAVYKARLSLSGFSP